MMVTFVSQCEKNALNTTRRVLDSFANRIGTNVWQTIITDEGLQVVKKLLRKTATKNTAVSCHWMSGRTHSELVWIVGNRTKFNEQGFVPVNITHSETIDDAYKYNWNYLPLIKCLTALAALFHDWGKASACFQKKLKKPNSKISDPLRHEWVSCLLLHAFVNGEEDSQWLARLATGEINENQFKNLSEIKKPLDELPPIASFVVWLILSHHHLSSLKKENKQRLQKEKGKTLKNFNTLFQMITAEFGYQNAGDIEECLNFPDGLPNQSPQWLEQAKRWAEETQTNEALAKFSLENGTWRLILHHARLALMLGDYSFSSTEKVNEKWQTKYKPIANTYKKTGQTKPEPKQKLDEHLVGVTRNALKAARILPFFEEKLEYAKDVRRLKRKSQDGFEWQDTAVAKLKAWRETEATQNLQHYGFFAVNMASTGCGKTFANAKVMRALSPDAETLRYVLALGLRALTLQTGDEYRHRIGLDSSELAVLIGSNAIMDLHHFNNVQQARDDDSDNPNGSNSEDALLESEIDYDVIPTEGFVTILKQERDRQFLYAPVLACTIDHLMGATETKRGGKYILPSLRLMSSDLVIDEIDDFNGSDLVAIGRLIHLAGMLGRKVMISSATIPPDLAEGYFNAYQAGWQIFATFREIKKTVGCAWIDEFTTHTESIIAKDGCYHEFQKHHAKFITKRVQELTKKRPQRIGEIISLDNLKASTDTDENKQNGYFEIIAQSIVQQHLRHFEIDTLTQKQVSFGVVRIANISPCVELTRYLLQREWQDDVDVRIMAYHSQQILLMRHEQEKHLDAVLKRDSKNPHAIFENPIIRKHLTESSAQNVIFIVVATPVEEVGRDHDFDFAIVEPSSYRSIIQIAGRVLRHRFEKFPTTPNIGLLQYNLKGLFSSKDDDLVFHRPGYESEHHRLDSHDLKQLIDESGITYSINAIPRIQCGVSLEPETSLIDLEHHVTRELLTAYDKKGAENLEGWLSSCWFLTALPQAFNEFRKGEEQVKLYLVLDNEEWKFSEKDNKRKSIDREAIYRIKRADDLTETERNRLWLHRDYEELIETLALKKAMTTRDAALQYGEISLPVRENGFVYFEQFGMITKKQTE